jgi:hypothetical protein
VNIAEAMIGYHISKEREKSMGFYGWIDSAVLSLTPILRLVC